MFDNNHLGGYGMSNENKAQESEGEWGGLKGLREMGEYGEWWLKNIKPTFMDINKTPIHHNEASAMYDAEMAEKKKAENNPSPDTPQP